MHVWHEVHRIESKSCAHPLPPLDAAYCRYGRRVTSTGGRNGGSPWSAPSITTFAIPAQLSFRPIQRTAVPANVKRTWVPGSRARMAVPPLFVPFTFVNHCPTFWTAPLSCSTRVNAPFIPPELERSPTLVTSNASIQTQLWADFGPLRPVTSIAIV